MTLGHSKWTNSSLLSWFLSKWYHFPDLCTGAPILYYPRERGSVSNEPLKVSLVKYVSKVHGQLCDSRKSYIASVTIHPDGRQFHTTPRTFDTNLISKKYLLHTRYPKCGSLNQIRKGWVCLRDCGFKSTLGHYHNLILAQVQGGAKEKACVWKFPPLVLPENVASQCTANQPISESSTSNSPNLAPFFLLNPVLCWSEKQCASSCRRDSNLSQRFSAQQGTQTSWWPPSLSKFRIWGKNRKKLMTQFGMAYFLPFELVIFPVQIMLDKRAQVHSLFKIAVKTFLRSFTTIQHIKWYNFGRKWA